MEIGKIYYLTDGEYVSRKTIYRLEKFQWELESFQVGYFWYKNKFGEGFTTKNPHDMKRMIEAPEAMQVLYGQK